MSFISNAGITRPIKYVAMSLLFFCGSTRLSHALPQLQSDTTLATAGYFQLSWQDEHAQLFELQQAKSENFENARSIYRGEDKATVISGLADGNYFYRVGNGDNLTWSKPVEVKVKHHPLSRAFFFFTLGAIMFVVTLAVLISGAKTRQRS